MNYKNIFFLGLLMLCGAQQEQLFAAAKEESMLLKLEKINDTQSVRFESMENVRKYHGFDIPEGSRFIRVLYQKEDGKLLPHWRLPQPQEDLFLLTNPLVSLEALKTNKELLPIEGVTPFIQDVTPYYKKNGMYNNPFRFITSDAYLSKEGKEALAQAIANKQADEEIFEAHVRGEMHTYHNIYLVKPGVDFEAEMTSYDLILGNLDVFNKSTVKNVTADYDAEGNEIVKKENKKENAEATTLSKLLSHKGKISFAAGSLAIGTSLKRAYNKALADKKISQGTTFGQFANKALKQALSNPFKAEHKAVAASVWATIATVTGCVIYDHTNGKKAA